MALYACGAADQPVNSPRTEPSCGQISSNSTLIVLGFPFSYAVKKQTNNKTKQENTSVLSLAVDDFEGERVEEFDRLCLLMDARTGFWSTYFFTEFRQVVTEFVSRVSLTVVCSRLSVVGRGVNK